jgi:hypothetical protein
MRSFQYTALICKNGMSGFAPIIKFEFATHSGARRINTLVCFTTSLGARCWAINQVLHHDGSELLLVVDARTQPRVKAVMESCTIGLFGALLAHLRKQRVGSGYAPLLRRAGFANGWLSPGRAI